MSPFEISIILAEAPGRPDIEATLQSIERSCEGIAAEVLVVRPSGRPPLRSSRQVTVRELIVDDGTLIPVRWGVGVRAAQAPAFACLTTEFTVHAAWARASLAALAGGAVGAAGGIDLVPGADMAATSVYLVRFGAYLPRAPGKPEPADQIPGDSAVYQRGDVVALPELLKDGFWEVEFHRRFKAQGRQLVAIPEGLATFGSSRSLRASLVLRFRHGIEFGENRVVRHRHNRALVIMAAPVVPAVLVARIARRTWRSRRGLRLLGRALPGIALLSIAWALGEARGAWSAGRRR